MTWKTLYWDVLTWLFTHTPARYIIEKVGNSQTEILTATSHELWRDVVYCVAATTKLVNKERIDTPDVFLVPDWYIHIGLGKQLKTGYSCYGRCLHDTKTKETVIMLNRKYVKLDTVYGSSVLVHELVHSVQYADGRGLEDEAQLEMEAVVFQQEFYDRHIALIEARKQGMVQKSVQ